ncbi:hypothetical protein PJI20_10235 [Mycobacterium kansasii]
MAFQTDSSRMLTAAGQLDTILQDVLGSLGRYVTMNQNLTGPGLDGTAALASLATTEDIATTGKQVSARFQSVIDMMRRGASEYQNMNEQNRAALSNIPTA